MPTRPAHPCAEPGCGRLVTAGARCPDHARTIDRHRGSNEARGYTSRHWTPFRRRYLALLISHDLLPVCGEALPDGPTQRDSACRDAGLTVFASADGSSLHLDHEPALEPWERTDPSRVCDPRRIVLKCASCHNRKTAREQRSWGGLERF